MGWHKGVPGYTPNLYTEETKQMNVGGYMKDSGGERLPFIKASDVRKGCSVKILAIREVHSPKSPTSKGFDGLFLDVKNGKGKFAMGVRFDSFDLPNISKQLRSTETDDWIGQSIKLITKKGSKGGMFVNVAPPPRKK
jgi:hypothetical protein